MITNFKKLFLSIIILFLAVCGYSKSFYYYYDTKSIPSGFSSFGLSVNSSISGVAYLFETNNLPDGFTVYKQTQTPNGPFWSLYFYDAVFGGWNTDISDTNSIINHGEAIMIFNPSPTPINQVFIGDVVQNSTTLVRKGFNLISSRTLKTGGISTVHGLSPNNGDIVYKLVNNSYSLYTFEDGNLPEWTPSEPVIEPFEGFWYFNSTSNSFNWLQSDNLPNVYNSTERRQLFSYKYYDPWQPSFYASILIFAAKLNTESMITFSYNERTLTNANDWFVFTSYGPGLQPNDENFTAYWAARPITFSRGYIRVSTW